MITNSQKTALEDKLNSLEVPTLIMIGDEDEPCIEPAVFMKRNIPGSGLAVFPQSGPRRLFAGTCGARLVPAVEASGHR